ncbi:uncharacterized protein LOC144119872 [Amblyomma americanum]
MAPKRSIKVYINNKLLAPSDTIKKYSKEHTVFRAPPKGNAPFIFRETHFSMDDPVASMTASGITRAYQFNHKNIIIRSGGYILFYGEWNARSEIKLLEGQTPIATVIAPNPAKKIAVVLKLYASGLLVRRADDPSGGSAGILLTRTALPMEDVSCTQPVKFYEYKAVTGERMY